MPATAEFNHEDFDRSRQKEADKALLVKFEIRSKQDKHRSLEEGRPIFKEVEYVDIKIPGNRGAGACRPATMDDKNRFPDHYRAFKDRTSINDIEGTPLSEWGLISRSLADELAFSHVKTVEQLAAMADTQVSHYMGLYKIREKAIAFLADLEDKRPIRELESTIESQAAEIESLKSSLADIIEKINSPDPDKNSSQNARAVQRAKRDVEKKVK